MYPDLIRQLCRPQYLLLWLTQLSAAPTFSLSPANAYILRCAGCHGMEGAGSLTGGIPDFRNTVAGFSYLAAGRRYVVQVPGVLASGLDPQLTADVMNHVMTRWGGTSLVTEFVPFTAAEVARLRRDPIQDVVSFRRALVVEMVAHKLPVAAYPWP
jgi:hypothetical protein